MTNLAIIGLALALHCLTGVGSSEVRVTRLEVPRHVKEGADVELRCQWDLNSLQLYSVKWYRDDEEFYRFMPLDDPEVTVFNQPGIHVNLDKSDGETLVLNNVEIKSGGRYKCEVISDYPQYHTADKSATMEVLVVPEEKPMIEGTKHEYHIGENAQLTCISARSFPPAQLSWFINDEEAPEENLEALPTVNHQDGLKQTKLRLQFTVSRQHFHKGEMTLRCSAKIHTLYYKTQQHSVDGQLTYNVPVMESRDYTAYSGSSPTERQPLAVMVVVVGGVTVLLEVMAGVLEQLLCR